MAAGLAIDVRFICVILDNRAVAREGRPDVTQMWRWAFQKKRDGDDALTGRGIFR